QWMMRITAYADRLISDLDLLDWPEPIKIMQRNWIGRSEGAQVDFLALAAGGDDPREWFRRRESSGWPAAPESESVIRVFTTRPDTLYGATYMVLAPEHPLVSRIVPDAWPEGTPAAWKGQFPGRPEGDVPPRAMVDAYVRRAQAKSDVERQVETKEKTGVFTGAFAVNPVDEERIPIFVADYVLMGYGTGAIMAVPAHDLRDCEFALQFDLPIPPVVMPPEDWLREHVAAAVKERPEAASLDLADRRVLEALYGRACLPGEELGGIYSIREAFAEEGIAIHSEAIEGLPTSRAKRRITGWLDERGLAREAVNYRLRDWLFSRQRYWGEPFPIVYDDEGLPIALRPEDLPVELPEMEDYRPETTDDPDAPPRPPLARAREWAVVTIDGREHRRELNTMPNWAGSCWYYLRYLDPRNDRHLARPEVERYWMLTPKEGGAAPESYDPATCRIGGVDLYVGGAEHAVLHLLYARFWHKVLHDLGHVSTPEPFHRLFNQGYVQAAAYTDERGVYVEASEVEEKDGKYWSRGKEVRREFGKMGKSLKNAVTPDEICSTYGADTLRLYEMYMGPLDVSKPWNTRDIVGVFRFLQRLWRNLVDEDTGALKVTDEPASDDLRRALHKTIDGVRRDMEALGFNTAIAKLIELNNQLTSLDAVPREVAAALVKMLAPLAPHIAEELWSRLGEGAEATIAYESYPEADPSLLLEDSIEVPVMIKGKVRARIRVAADADAAAMERAALEQPRVRQQLEGATVRKVICVPGKMVNIVVG
ncbi:MAG: leucine--tRNA ligase, partial [Planctomycetes bacterium]|nr:leucine--tRNA ligase [Planctomycetota bacterium]